MSRARRVQFSLVIRQPELEWQLSPLTETDANFHGLRFPFSHCRNPSTLPPDGEGIDPAVGSQGPAGTPSIPVVVGIRLHFHQMVMGLTQLSAAKAQLGLRLFSLL